MWQGGRTCDLFEEGREEVKDASGARSAFSWADLGFGERSMLRSQARCFFASSQVRPRSVLLCRRDERKRAD